MQRRERVALVIALLILIGLPIAILGYQYWLRPTLAKTRTIDVIASVPEAGGFQPGSINVKAGETITLRFSSSDVTHGVAIGPGLGIDLGPIDPGHIKEVTLTFDRAGTYTFYCNTWCSPNHWRMRGVVEVNDPAGPTAAPQHDPIIEALATEGVDIDANVNPNGRQGIMPIFNLERRPSAARGAEVANKLMIPADLNNLAWRRSHTPAQGLDLLITANPGVNKADAIDAVAYLWVGDVSVAGNTTTLYNKNCTACHGETGNGKGPASALTIKQPVAFSDPGYMFNMRSDVLYAKVRRGGMGTDMPNFGTVFTPDETWALVDYLWKLAFSP